MARIIGDLEDLAEEAHRIARSEARNKERQAERQAQRIEQQARQEADELQERILAQARDRAEEIRRQRRAQVAQKARRMRLTAREELLAKVWDRAEDALRDRVQSDEYAQILRRLAWLAVETLGTGDLVLAADPRGHELLTRERLEDWSRQAGEAFGGRVEFGRAPEALETWGGLVAERKGGRQRMDATFPVRLQQAQVEMRDEAFGFLTRPQ